MSAISSEVPVTFNETIVVDLLEKQLYMQSLQLIALGFIAGAIMAVVFVRWWKYG